MAHYYHASEPSPDTSHLIEENKQHLILIRQLQKQLSLDPPSWSFFPPKPRNAEVFAEELEGKIRENESLHVTMFDLRQEFNARIADWDVRRDKMEKRVDRLGREGERYKELYEGQVHRVEMMDAELKSADGRIGVLNRRVEEVEIELFEVKTELLREGLLRKLGIVQVKSAKECGVQARVETCVLLHRVEFWVEAWRREVSFSHAQQANAAKAFLETISLLKSQIQDVLTGNDTVELSKWISEFQDLTKANRALAPISEFCKCMQAVFVRLAGAGVDEPWTDKKCAQLAMMGLEQTDMLMRAHDVVSKNVWQNIRDVGEAWRLFLQTKSSEEEEDRETKINFLKAAAVEREQEVAAGIPLASSTIAIDLFPSFPPVMDFFPMQQQQQPVKQDELRVDMNDATVMADEMIGLFLPTSANSSYEPSLNPSSTPSPVFGASSPPEFDLNGSRMPQPGEPQDEIILSLKRTYHENSLKALRELALTKKSLRDCENQKYLLETQLAHLTEERKQNFKVHVECKDAMRCARQELTEMRDSYEDNIRMLSERVVELDLELKQKNDYVDRLVSHGSLLSSVKQKQNTTA